MYPEYALIIWLQCIEMLTPPTSAVLATFSRIEMPSIQPHQQWDSCIVATNSSLQYALLQANARSFVSATLIGFGNIWIWSESVHSWQCTRINACVCMRVWDCAWIATTARWCERMHQIVLTLLTNTNFMCFHVSTPEWLNPYKCKLRFNISHHFFPSFFSIRWCYCFHSKRYKSVCTVCNTDTK